MCTSYFEYGVLLFLSCGLHNNSHSALSPQETFIYLRRQCYFRVGKVCKFQITGWCMRCSSQKKITTYLLYSVFDILFSNDERAVVTRTDRYNSGVPFCTRYVKIRTVRSIIISDQSTWYPKYLVLVCFQLADYYCKERCSRSSKFKQRPRVSISWVHSSLVDARGWVELHGRSFFMGPLFITQKNWGKAVA